MTGRSNVLSAYSKVASAEHNKLQQLVMLYDGAIKFLRLAATDIDTSNLPAKAEHSNRALDIISYLQSILDFQNGGDVAPTLDALYTGATAMTLRASARLDSALMRRVADDLVPVRDAWATIAAQNSAELAASAMAAPVEAGSLKAVL